MYDPLIILDYMTDEENPFIEKPKKRKMKKLKRISGTLILVIAMAMAWLIYDWKLMLIILLALWGNNLERTLRR